MLTQAENDLLTRTNAGTPMGRLMRRYWIPALLSEELPKAGGAPIRLTLLGEKLVAYRDHEGKAALVDTRCPHRNADLFFGRNDPGGIRCVYHGWQFDRDGRCVDMPSEPGESNFKNKVKLTAYPCEERGGVIWAYMGPKETKPAFPDLEWTAVPASHRYVTRRLQECNWLQGYEGGWDTAHLPFLHRGDTRGSNYFSGPGKQVVAGLPTKYEFATTDYGFVYGRGRAKPEGGGMNWECALMFMPSWKLFQPFAGPDQRMSLLAWVPQDDHNCVVWAVEFHPDRPLKDEEMAWSKAYNYTHVETIPGSIRPVRNRDNDYLIDREVQASGRSWTGIHGLGLQDSAIQETMGPIADRTQEHLGASDEVIIRLRRHLLKTLKTLDDDAPLFGLDPASYRVRCRILPVAEGEPLEQHLDRLRIDAATPVT